MSSRALNAIPVQRGALGCQLHPAREVLVLGCRCIPAGVHWELQLGRVTAASSERAKKRVLQGDRNDF